MNLKLEELRAKAKKEKEALKSKTWWARVKKYPKWMDKLKFWKWFTYR